MKVTIIFLLFLAASCSSVENTKNVASNSRKLKQAISIFNKTQDQKELFKILKLRKDADRLYRYNVELESGDEVVVSASKKQIVKYFSFNKRILEGVDKNCNERAIDASKISAGDNPDSAFSKLFVKHRESEIYSRCYERYIEDGYFSAYYDPEYFEVPQMLGLMKARTTITGYVESSCNGETIRNDNPFEMYLKCHINKKIKEYNKLEQETAKKLEEARAVASKVHAEDTANETASLEYCTAWFSLYGAKREIDNKIRVTKRTLIPPNMGQMRSLEEQKMLAEDNLKRVKIRLQKSKRTIPAENECKVAFKDMFESHGYHGVVE